MRIRILFEAIPRIISLLILWECVDLLLRYGTQIFKGFELLLIAPYSAIMNILTLIASIVAIATIVTASPLLYVTSLIILAIAKGSVGILISFQSIVGLIAMLVMDHVKSVYREGQTRCVKYRQKVSTLISTAMLCVGVSILCIAIATYVTRFITAITVLGTAMGGSSILSLLFSNPIVQIAIALVLIRLFYRLLIEGFDIVSLFLYPSRRVSLSVLTSRQDVDVFISTPLQTLRLIIVSSFVAPPLYAILYSVVLPLLETYLPFVSVLENIVFRVAIAIAIFILVSLAIRAMSIGLLIGNVKRVLVVSLTMLIAIYGAGVALTLQRVGDIVYALLSPDIDTLSKLIGHIYTSYYLLFFYILNALLQLIGVAP